MEIERNLILKALSKGIQQKLVSEIGKLPKLDAKNQNEAISLRLAGNKLFAKKDHGAKVHEKIWKLYSNSIAFAFDGSEELAAGYSNRSALLLHLCKYRDCLMDIDRALKITASHSMKVKLFCRQCECLVALQEGKQRSSLLKANYWLNRIDNAVQNKKALIQLVNKAEKALLEDVPDHKKEKKKHQIKCNNDAFEISYNKTYGRFLIANRYIRPGEFICVEEPQISSVDFKKTYAYCSHCLAISWSLIPCKSCSLCMFCSEECRRLAWEKYHDIECCSNIFLKNNWFNYMKLSERAVIMGIKEAGSINKLKKLVESIDNCPGNGIQKLPKKRQIFNHNFESVYSLTHSKNLKLLMSKAEIIAFALPELAQNTILFGKDFKYRNNKSLMENEEAIFIGSLMLRLFAIFEWNAFPVVDSSHVCKNNYNSFICGMQHCCRRGFSFSPIASLMNHSCNPNVGKFYTNDGKVVYYALCPIRKNTQIFSSYSCDYLTIDRSDRQEWIKEMYEFQCNCVACLGNWPGIGCKSTIDKMISKEKSSLSRQKKVVASSLLLKNEEIMKIFGNSKKCSRHYFDEITIRNFCADIENLLKEVSPPCSVTYGFLLGLRTMMESTYSSKLHVPKKCRAIRN